MVVNDPSHGFKLLSQDKNSLFLSWKPTTNSDYTYKKVDAIGSGEMNSHVPLAYLKVLQYGINAATNTEGCKMQIKISVACKGLKALGATVLSGGQTTALNALN
jgi:hypothetical protein